MAVEVIMKTRTAGILMTFEVQMMTNKKIQKIIVKVVIILLAIGSTFNQRYYVIRKLGWGENIR